MSGSAPRIESPLCRRSTILLLAFLGATCGSFFVWAWPKAPRQHESLDSQTENQQHVGLLLDLNAATADELSLIPGLGPVLARRIIHHRWQYGEFQSIESLLQVHGVGPKILARVDDFCVLTSTDQSRQPIQAHQAEND